MRRLARAETQRSDQRVRRSSAPSLMTDSIAECERRVRAQSRTIGRDGGTAMTSRFGFLSDEERVADGASAVPRVRRAMALDGTADLFGAANLLAQAHLHARRVDDAAEVSLRAVECGQRMAARPGRAALLFHVLRPQVTLLRIESLA